MVIEDDIKIPSVIENTKINILPRKKTDLKISFAIWLQELIDNWTF